MSHAPHHPTKHPHPPPFIILNAPPPHQHIPHAANSTLPPHAPPAHSPQRLSHIYKRTPAPHRDKNVRARRDAHERQMQQRYATGLYTDTWHHNAVLLQSLDLVEEFLEDLGMMEALRCMREERDKKRHMKRREESEIGVLHESHDKTYTLTSLVEEFLQRKAYLSGFSQEAHTLVQRLKDIMEITSKPNEPTPVALHRYNTVAMGTGAPLMSRPAPGMHAAGTPLSGQPRLIPMVPIIPAGAVPANLLPVSRPTTNAPTTTRRAMPPPTPINTNVAAPSSASQASTPSPVSAEQRAKSRRKRKAPPKRMEPQRAVSPPAPALVDDFNDDLLDSFPLDEDILSSILSSDQFAQNIADRINTRIDNSPHENRREVAVAEELAPEIIRSLGFVEGETRGTPPLRRTSQSGSVSQGDGSGRKRKRMMPSSQGDSSQASEDLGNVSKRPRLDSTISASQEDCAQQSGAHGDNVTATTMTSTELPPPPTAGDDTRTPNLEKLAKSLSVDVFSDLPDGDDMESFLETL